jgi:phage terminase small subunit
LFYFKRNGENEMSGDSAITLTPEQMELARGLTNLQRMSVLNQFLGMPPVEAYKAAGGKAKNDQSAAASVSRMLKDVNVRAFNDSLLESITSKAIMTREEAMEILSHQARTSIKDVARFRKAQVGEDEDGNPVMQTVWESKDSDEITDEQAMAITEVSAGKDGLKLKLHDQKAAIKQLADMKGWNAAQRVEHTGKDGEAIKTEEIGDNALARRVAFLLAKGSKT